jgi:glucosamine kinase
MGPEHATKYLIGIDGGGTSTRAVVARTAGPILGRGVAGPSALGQGVPQAWRNIEIATQRAFAAAGLAMPGWETCAIGAGLSGVSNAAWRDSFLAAQPALAHLALDGDAFVMLLGAHGGAPGAIVAAGTGSVAQSLRADGSRDIVGGWGFPSGDEGSGAWLGLHAMRHAQSALDGRANAGPLALHIFKLCGSDRAALQGWCARAGQFAYATLAPAVFDYESDDPAAAALLLQATAALESMAWAIEGKGRLPLAVCGSIGKRLAPRMSPAVRSRLVEPAADAATGALMLVRQALRAETEAQAA